MRNRKHFRSAPVCCLAILVTAASGQTPLTVRNTADGAPVSLEGQVLFRVRTNLGPFSAEDRAAATSARLIDLAKDLTIPLDAISVVPSGSSTDIIARDHVLMTVTDADAKQAQRPRAELASDYAGLIRSAVARRRGEYSYRSLLLGAAYTLAATLILLFALWGLRRIFPTFYRKMGTGEGRLIRSIHLQRAELVSADRIRAILIRFLKILRLGIAMALFYIYAPLVLSFFPWTREYAPKVLGYVLNPLQSAGAAFLSYLPSLAVVLVSAAIAWCCARISRFLFEQMAKGTIVWPGFYPEWGPPTYKIVRFLIVAFTGVVIFPYLPGSDSPAFKGISIFLGVLFSLGSSSAIANVVAGTILTYTRAFQIGDRVKIADTAGDVVGKTLLATRIRTIKNELVTVPNAMVLGSHIVNYSGSSADGAALILHTTVTIGYDAPWRTIHALLVDAAAHTPGILKEPAPFVLQTALDDFYIHYEVNGYTAEPSRMASIYALLHQNIQDAFNEAGVEIMSPHCSSLRDGNRKAIPDQYLPQTYGAPSFRVTQDSARAATTS